MAAIIMDRDREEVVDLVEEYGRDRWNESRGQVEELKEEVKNIRGILARLVNAVADKAILSEEELVRIIRGY